MDGIEIHYCCKQIDPFKFVHRWRILCPQLHHLIFWQTTGEWIPVNIVRVKSPCRVIIRHHCRVLILLTSQSHFDCIESMTSITLHRVPNWTCNTDHLCHFRFEMARFKTLVSLSWVGCFFSFQTKPVEDDTSLFIFCSCSLTTGWRGLSLSRFGVGVSPCSNKIADNGGLAWRDGGSRRTRE